MYGSGLDLNKLAVANLFAKPLNFLTSTNNERAYVYIYIVSQSDIIQDLCKVITTTHALAL